MDFGAFIEDPRTIAAVECKLLVVSEAAIRLGKDAEVRCPGLPGPRFGASAIGYATNMTLLSCRSSGKPCATICRLSGRQSYARWRCRWRTRHSTDYEICASLMAAPDPAAQVRFDGFSLAWFVDFAGETKLPYCCTVISVPACVVNPLKLAVVGWSPLASEGGTTTLN